MFQLISFLILTVLAGVTLVISIGLILFHLGASLRQKENPEQIKRIKKVMIFFVAVMILNLGLIVFSQITAYTPGIQDENGTPTEDSISELVEIELNGRKQWISLRGWDKNKPVLLFLAGGPGGTQMAAVRHELSALEKHFVVVNWDQPGSGKSYDAEPIEHITDDTYIRDGYALTKYLSERFEQDKIYLVGESWGSALGIFLIDRNPEAYHAFIGTGQMIDFAETERIDYRIALEIAEGKNDNEIIEKLKENGPPPYYGKDVTWKSAVYLNYLSDYMTNNPEIDDTGYNTIRDIGSPEYGLIDKINYFRGVINTFNHVYQQLYTIDLREDYVNIDVPVYFFLGRHDINAPTSLVEEYMNVLDAPKKEIIWFENSGHNPWINENDKFTEELLLRFSQ
ncbi:MAG: alpha/beta hydrolase [Alkalibacterium sp.]|uniref:alpha/beta fold hydrolase n=1 Tax=Alkalibacterium sp. TaxID=1872447 RepID=UPI00397104C6